MVVTVAIASGAKRSRKSIYTHLFKIQVEKEICIGTRKDYLINIIETEYVRIYFDRWNDKI